MDWDKWTNTQQYFGQLGFSKGQITRAYGKSLQSQEINPSLLLFHGAVIEPQRCIFKRRVLYNLLVEAGIISQDRGEVFVILRLKDYLKE